jgi:CysZ protein
MLTDLLRAFAMLREPRVRGVLWLGIGLSLLTLAALALGVEGLVRWVSDTGYGWLDGAFQVLGVLGTIVIAWFLFPGVVVAVSSIFLDRVVDATEDRYFPQLPATASVPLAAAVPAGLRLFGITLLLNLMALPLYFVPLINLPAWLALNGYLVAREYVELVGLRRLAPAMVATLRRDNRLAFWASGVLIAFLLAVPLVNLIAPIVGAAFMTLRFQRYGGDATHAGRELR